MYEKAFIQWARKEYGLHEWCSQERWQEVYREYQLLNTATRQGLELEPQKAPPK